tara:strand:+ start:1940 stop:3961 length:2022 start_codon:yes stop_codon:yes gene_type:complete
MNDKIISINLETQTAPKITEARGKDYIEYGTEDWKNLYPQFLIDLYYNSSTHAAVINSTAEMIAGEDIVIEAEEDENLDMYVKLQKFFRHANGKESLHQIIKKIAFDFKLQGAYAIHIIWNQEKTEIAEIYHVPVERVRAGKPNDMGKIDTYFISADWSNTRTHKPYAIAAFNTKDRTTASQLLYTGSYSPNMDCYHTPDYLAGCNWALVDQKVAEFHLNNIENGFSGSYFISFANGIPTAEERHQIEKSLVDKFTGAKNSGKFILTFSDDKTRTPEITPISVSDADKQYLALQELLVQNILTAHRVTSKTLMGIDSTNGFSSNTDELINAANFYVQTVVRSFQLNILDTLQTIFSVNNMDLEAGFVQLKPITVQFDSKTVREVMTQNEIREDLGLPALDEEDTVDEKSNFSEVGMIDGKPVFSTIEEAEAHAETLGCEGYHEHEYEGKTVYMACKDHSSATDLSNLEKTCLDTFLEDIEDVPEDWELVHREEVNGEHRDFDFEKTINKIANNKLELASTGTARPNSKSEEDGVNESYNNYYKVRYVYTEDSNLTNKSGTSREFCSKMEAANKKYRKADIIQMGNMAVNPGFGPNGAATYDILLYKGGPQCFHYWERLVYKTSLRGAKSGLNDSQIIEETRAESEGFTIDRQEDDLVMTPPRLMINHGYLNPR